MDERLFLSFSFRGPAHTDHTLEPEELPTCRSLAESSTTVHQNSPVAYCAPYVPEFPEINVMVTFVSQVCTAEHEKPMYTIFLVIKWCVPQH